jgi:apolipoprotein N-acyltransferase
VPGARTAAPHYLLAGQDPLRANARMPEPSTVEEPKDDDDAAPAPAPPAPAPIASKPGATPLPARVAYPLAVLCGFLYFLAFPGMNLWPLAFVAMAPLIVALQGQAPRRALGLGWAAGFTMTMCGFYWLLNMLQVFSGFGTPLCLFFMAILCAYQAGRIALSGWLYGRAEARGWPAAPAFAAAFAASEFVYPLLFPWYYAATVHNAPLFLQTADLGGPYLVGLVLVAANLGVAELVTARRAGASPDRRVLAAALAVPAVAALYGYARLRAVDAAAAEAQPVKVGIVQGNQPLLGKHNALGVHLRRTAELKRQGVDLVLWSEGASARADPESSDYAEVRRAYTNRLGVPTIVGGLLARLQPGGRPLYFNTALMADRDGSIKGRYDKQYLLAFGEYIPFGETFPALYEVSPNSSRFSAGTSLEPLPFGDHRISALICYEDILPGFVNAMVRHADPDLLVNLTNDTWFDDPKKPTTEPWIHLALAQLRAVEHRRYLLRATNTGISAMIDPVGRVPVHGGTFTEEALIVVPKFMRSVTGYEILGDWPWRALALASFAMAFFRRDRVMKALGRG